MMHRAIRTQADLVKLLDEVKKRYKQGRFENTRIRNSAASEARLEDRSDLYFLSTKLKTCLQRSPRLKQLLEPWRYYEAMALVAEISDYFNRIDADQSRDLIEQSRKLVRGEIKARGGSNTSREERSLLKTKIRFACAGINEIYKNRDYGEAKELISICYDFVAGNLVNEGDPCWGTIGFVSYIQGKVNRGLARYQQANDKYAESCEAYHRRALHKLDRESISFSKWKTGISLGLGIGFTDLTRGYIDRAMYSLIPARTLLLDSGGQFHQTYLDFLIASAKRAYSGNDDKRQLEEAIGLLKECERRFDADHLEMRQRTALELAIAYFHFGNDLACKEKLSEVERYAIEKSDRKLLSRCLIANSHLARKENRLEESAKLAEQAIVTAEDFREVYCEALLAVAQAEEALKKYKDAYARINAAITSMYSREDTNGEPLPINHKILSMCYISLARVCLAAGKLGEAEEQIKKWEQLKPYIKHRFVHDYAAAVEKRIVEVQSPFVIEPAQVFDETPDNPTIGKYDFFDQKLKSWLLLQVKRKTSAVGKTARILGVSRPTIYDWKKTAANKGELKKRRGKS